MKYGEREKGRQYLWDMRDDKEIPKTLKTQGTGALWGGDCAHTHCDQRERLDGKSTGSPKAAWGHTFWKYPCLP